MADGTGQTVDHSLLVFVDMSVRMGKPMGMHIGMFVIVVVDMIVHKGPPFVFFLSYLIFVELASPTGGYKLL